MMYNTNVVLKVITYMAEKIEQVKSESIELAEQNTHLVHEKDELTRLYSQTMKDNREWQKKHRELRERTRIAEMAVSGLKEDLKFCVQRETAEKIRHCFEMQQFSKTWIAQVVAERIRQDEKYGVQEHSDEKWLAILVKELGEVSRIALDERPNFTFTEDLIHVAAVAVAWLEYLEHKDKGETDGPEKIESSG